MLKRTMMLAAVLLVAGSGSAAAEFPEARNWHHGGAGLKANVGIVSHGTFAFTSAAGGLECPIVMSVVLKPGTKGTILSFNPLETAKCKYSGALAALCGAVVTHEATNIPWTIHAGVFKSNGKYGFLVTGTELHFKGSGGLCPNLTTTGELRVTVDTPHAITTFHVEAGTNFHSPTLGAVAVSGTIAATPVATYGIED